MRSLRRALLPALAGLALAGLTLAPPAAAASAPLGGSRLAGTAVVSTGTTSPPAVSAASYVVADLDSGAVYAAKDPHGTYLPASTLKTLTALTLIPRLDPAQQVAPTQEDANVDGSKVGLVPALTYSVHDLFTALLVVSANDAAQTLATAAGGHEATARLMNDEAERLQAADTHVVNSSGLDAEGQVSSAYDLALIARAAMRLPAFRDYVAVRRSFIPAPGGRTIEIDTHDKLLVNYPGAIGIKNGYTDAARASFVGAATRGGHTLVVTLLRADPAVWKDAAILLDWGFAAVATGPRPVGVLVDPVAAQPAAAASPSPAAAAAERRVVPAAATRPAATGSSFPVRTTLLVLLLLALGGGTR
jgi:D-alanyl-D-alanine carboxypeptidase (penicillin-binding protein 5/6)